jgi:hypothetical protein
VQRLLGIAVVTLAVLAAPGAAQGATLVGIVVDQGQTFVVADDEDSAGVIDLRLAANGATPVVAVENLAGATAATGCDQIDAAHVACQGTIDGVVVYGDDGDDRISLRLIADGVAPMSALVFGGPGNDTLEARPDNRDVPQPEVGIAGEGGNDKIVTGNGVDEVEGGDGNDDIETFKGADVVRGGAGDDTISVGGGDAADVADGGAGFDQIKADLGDFNRFGREVTITVNGVADDGEAGEGDNVIAIEKLTVRAARATVTGSDAADDIFVEADAATVRGLGGDDKLTTYDGNDTIEGGEGNDVLEGGFGNDLLDGGPGVDQFSGDRTESNVFAVGNDEIRARDGNAEQINCGIGGGDRAIVDFNDVVASDCESVDRSAPPQPPGPGPELPAAKPGAPVVLGKLSIRAIVAKGLVVRISCPAACSVVAELRVTKALARKLGLGRSRVLAKGRATRTTAGNARTTVKVVKKARKRLRRMRKAKVTLQTATTVAGATTRASRSLSLKR